MVKGKRIKEEEEKEEKSEKNNGPRRNDEGQGLNFHLEGYQ